MAVDSHKLPELYLEGDEQQGLVNRFTVVYQNGSPHLSHELYFNDKMPIEVLKRQEPYILSRLICFMAENSRINRVLSTREIQIPFAQLLKRGIQTAIYLARLRKILPPLENFVVSRQRHYHRLTIGRVVWGLPPKD